MTIDEAKKLVVQAGRRLVESGLISRTWGNVSCRIDDSCFVITPRGRDYLSLTPDEIVRVEIEDCSYIGNIKPSSEKGIHAEVYKLRPEINFVIHTHQKNASAVSASGILSISNAIGAECLGDEVLCASYALPGTKKLRNSVAAAVARSEGKAVIMRNHGALCYGKSYEEAFLVASELENACEDFLIRQYLRISQRTGFDASEMRSFALSRITGMVEKNSDCNMSPYCESKRTEKGFSLYTDNGDVIEVRNNSLNDALPGEVKLYKAIYEKHRNINYIIHSVAPDTAAVSCANITSWPFLDDFAQIVGTSVKTVENDAAKIAAALNGASAVFIHNYGAICCGSSKGDAAATAMVLEKNCKALIAAALFENAKPINFMECKLMRLVYLKKYSKLNSH
ncbi:MAG: hypothetical protein APF77_20890 [Clostridia bacterium BRH_c25]|nr:MAG: hypothetical protein APF77_20890 [Clostridia bacterium BRH_c25]